MDPFENPVSHESPRGVGHDPEAVLIILQIALCGAFVGLAGLGILLLRQDILLHRLVANQRPVAAAATAETLKIRGLVLQLQALGKRYPDYQAGVLSRFQLAPGAASNYPAAAAAAAAPAPAKAPRQP